MLYENIPFILRKLGVYRLNNKEMCAKKWSLIFIWGLSLLIKTGSSWAGDDYYRLVLLPIWGQWEFILPFKSNVPVLPNMPKYGIEIVLNKIWIFYGATSNKYEHRHKYFIFPRNKY